ncbi:MAG TPA: hypothetical protein ENK62_02545 [Chromatiales bacterium]|nr:hypothetical protein [Chromatiales bacterium]
MDYILLPGRGGRCFRIRYTTWQRVVLLLMGFVLVPVLTAGAGYYAGLRAGDAATVARWRADVAVQSAELEQVRHETQARVEALARRIGDLQAELYRLDALGARLVHLADLDDGEFDFSGQPGVGGPRQAPASLGEDTLDEVLAALEAKLRDRRAQLEALDRVLQGRKLREAVRPAGSPVKSGFISSPFGKRVDPFTGKSEFHKGLDFAAKVGSEVVAVAGGIVTWAGKRPGYGYLVEIDHGGGFVTRYGHNQKLLVKTGDRVERGQVIGLVGSTGRSTGPHVHFEVLHDGKVVDPRRYLHAKG